MPVLNRCQCPMEVHRQPAVFQNAFGLKLIGSIQLYHHLRMLKFAAAALFEIIPTCVTYFPFFRRREEKEVDEEMIRKINRRTRDSVERDKYRERKNGKKYAHTNEKNKSDMREKGM